MTFTPFNIYHTVQSPYIFPAAMFSFRGLAITTPLSRLPLRKLSFPFLRRKGADSWGREWESRSPAVWPQGNWPTETTATPNSASIPPTPPPPPPGFATSAPLVRAEEALIVLIVLLLWIGAIALFFNRWGKIRMLEPYQPKFQQSAQHRPSCPLAVEQPAAPIVQFRSLSKFNLEFECVNPSLRPRQNSVFASAVFSPTFNPPRKAKSALDIQTLVMADEQHLLQQLDSIDSTEYPIRVTKLQRKDVSFLSDSEGNNFSNDIERIIYSKKINFKRLRDSDAEDNTFSTVEALQHETSMYVHPSVITLGVVLREPSPQPVLQLLYPHVVELRHQPVEETSNLFFNFIVSPEALATQVFLQFWKKVVITRG
ncbi:hypothetical protein J437_LFUL011115 [Ladona fulva]|uniref:Fibronectin type III domain-containing protein n=1 Tax=Ladona fulva TaxID=123851 RepID=A0A8K0P2K4_LADFU|nr:hypothetical protein J437_LFUL011115 [Ladona fulva]